MSLTILEVAKSAYRTFAAVAHHQVRTPSLTWEELPRWARVGWQAAVGQMNRLRDEGEIALGQEHQWARWHPEKDEAMDLITAQDVYEQAQADIEPLRPLDELTYISYQKEADREIVDELYRRLMDTFNAFAIEREEVDFIDGYMAVHNFLVTVIRSIEEEQALDHNGKLKFRDMTYKLFRDDVESRP